MNLAFGMLMGGGGGGGAPNLLATSNLFAPFVTSLTITEDATPDPYGGNAGAAAARTSTNISDARIRRTTAQAVLSPYAFSVHAKANSSGLLYLRNLAIDSGTTDGVVHFDLSSGTPILTYGSIYTGKCGAISMGGGWWRCWLAGTTMASIGNNLVDMGVTSGASATGGTAGHSIYLYGAQLNVGLYPSSFRATA